jgi:hypothetical protein
VSSQDGADAAGVTRLLVRHYFPGIREVLPAVVASAGGALSDLCAGPKKAERKPN